jgi:hypothetical protein
VEAKAEDAPLDWQNCVHELKLSGGFLDGSLSSVKLISAGRSGPGYIDSLHALNFGDLFSKNDLGSYIEELRNEWASEFDFVLIDSRTGVTDIGGICTVHLADALVLFFTATHSSTKGVLEIFARARKARERLPLDRGRLIAVPVPARDESRNEYEKAAQWKRTFADQFRHLYRDWLPTGTSVQDAIENLKIPYFPYWSFGEGLPIRDGVTDPSGLGRAYEVLARLLVSNLNWDEAWKGQALPPQPLARARKLSSEWLNQHRHTALLGLKSISKSGFMEVYHYIVDSEIRKSQAELRTAARQAMITTFGWPIGVVLEKDDAKPKATNDGIVAEVIANEFSGAGKRYDYWTLTKNGDFYTLMSLFEDDRDKAVIFSDIRIVRTTEAILHAANLYRALGTEPNATIDLTIKYAGLRGRVLTTSHPYQNALASQNTNDLEDESVSKVSFRLSAVASDIVRLVETLCEPVFVLFNFAHFEHKKYETIVSNFIAGKVA